MPELLRVKTKDYVFSIKTVKIEERRRTHLKTITSKGGSIEPYSFKFKPAIEFIEAPKIYAEGICSLLLAQSTIKKCSKIELPNANFFENTDYQFEWIFTADIFNAAVVNRSVNINDSFIFSPAEDNINARLTGTINTRNDVGWMELPLRYSYNNLDNLVTFAFEILPTKMLLNKDLPAMYQDIDHVFPLWRYSFVEKTSQDVSKSRKRDSFPLMWLAQFTALRERFTRALSIITHAPHSRLQPNNIYAKASRIKGRVPHRLAEMIINDFTNSQLDKRYKLEKKRLSVDTPENQFIKMVVTRCKTSLSKFAAKLQSDNELDGQRVSKEFIEQLNHWQKPLNKILGQSFMREVSNFKGYSSESLVLQQKTGYSSVYRIWQDLKLYLDLFDSQSTISMKSVAEIYEIWCFLSIKKILEKDLGFNLVESRKSKLELKSFFEYQLKDGFGGSFKFERTDGVKARLAHEPRFTKSGNIRSYSVSQQPDIALEVSIPVSIGNGETEQKFIWLFDAKYRIKTDSDRFGSQTNDLVDLVPEDAINQMHRYRDALVRFNEPEKNTSFEVLRSKTRPIVGAYALYPGFFNQETSNNPYQESIDQVGIGAFALLPSTTESSTGYYWLLSFLRSQIDSKHGLSIAYPTRGLVEQLFIQEGARISYDGMKQVLYHDLTFTIALGDDSRNSSYFDMFINGKAKYYHVPKATFEMKYKSHIAQEIRFLALATPDPRKHGIFTIGSVWPIKKLYMRKRSTLTLEQTGKISDSDEQYYLFELNPPLFFIKPSFHFTIGKFRESMKLTRLEYLQETDSFESIREVYEEAIANKL